MINVWNSNIFSLSCTAIVCLIYNYTWKQQKCYNSSQCNVIGCFFIPCCEERIVLSGCIFLLPCFHSSITLCQSIVWPHLGQMLACLKAALTWLSHLFLCQKLRCDHLEKSVDCYWGKGFWWPLPIFLRNFPVNQWCRSQHCCSKKVARCCVSSPTANQHVVELMLTWLHKASFSTVLNMLICIKQFSTAHDTPCSICWPTYMMTFVYSVGQYWLVYHWLLFWLHDVLFWSYFLVMCRCQILCQNLLVWQFICILYHSTDFTMEPC